MTEASPRTILVVDDDPPVRRVIARVLRRAGHAVIEASDGFEARERLADSDVDLMLTDHMMPGMTGVQLAQGALAERPELRVVLISGTAEHDVRESLGELTHIGVLQKPVMPEGIVAAVERALDADPTLH